MALPLESVYRAQAAKWMYRRGSAYEQQRSYQQAIAAFTQALDRGYPRPAEALIRRGICRIRLKDVVSAIADFETIIDVESTAESAASFSLAQAHYYRGKLRQESGNEAGALADWSSAIAHHPTYPEPHYHRALVLLSQGCYDRALVDLDAAIEADPTLAKAYFQRGNLRYQLGNVPGAAADWEYAARIDCTLEGARQKLETVQQAAYDAQLTEVLIAPLAEKGLSVKVQHKGYRLDIHVHREVGTGVSYYTLPELIRKHLVPLHLAEITHFQLIGRAGEVNRPDWDQSYDLYKGQPCPPSNWQAAISTLFLFPPFAVPAFVQAAQVKRSYKKGKYIEALRASKAVKGLCVAGSITLGVCTLLPLGYAAYDSMKETPTFKLAEKVERTSGSSYQEIFKN